MEITTQSLAVGLDTVWVLLCAALVFFMEAGFAALEAGLIHSRNSLNIMMNGLIGFFLFGFALMYGADKFGMIGTSGFFLQGDFSHLGLKIPIYAF